jgi:hypothetical protein
LPVVWISCVCSVSPLEYVDGPVLVFVVLFHLHVSDSVLTVHLCSGVRRHSRNNTFCNHLALFCNHLALFWHHEFDRLSLKICIYMLFVQGYGVSARWLDQFHCTPSNVLW